MSEKEVQIGRVAGFSGDNVAVASDRLKYDGPELKAALKSVPKRGKKVIAEEPPKSTALGMESDFLHSATDEMSGGDFKPVRILDIHDKDDRYEYRWLNVAKLEKNGWRDLNGWEVIRNVDSSSARVNSVQSLGDKVHPLDGAVRTGDLVLARMPKQRALSRRDYYRKRSLMRQELIQMKKQLDPIGGTVEYSSRRGSVLDNGV